MTIHFLGRKSAILLLVTLLIFWYVKFDQLQPSPERAVNFHDFLEYYPLREGLTWNQFVYETAARPPAPTHPAHLELLISISIWNRIIYAADCVPFTIVIQNKGSDAVGLRIRLYVLSGPDERIMDFTDLATDSMEGHTRLEMSVFYPVRPELQGEKLALGYFVYSYSFLLQTGWVSETIPANMKGELIDFGQISFQTYPDRLRLVGLMTLFSFALAGVAVVTARAFGETIGEARFHSWLDRSQPVLIRSAVCLGYLAIIVMLGFVVILAWTFLYG
jgi:hypothetical protein